jgi:hypothetical protein
MCIRDSGQSFLPVLTGEKDRVRDHVLAGIWGREVHLIDADSKYARAPQQANLPLSMWSNRWSSMPVHHSMPEYEFPTPDERAFLDTMPGTKVPVIRQPFREGDLLPFWAYGRFSGNHLYDLKNDPAEDQNRSGEAREAESADRLREALKEIEAPDDQFARLGLA